MNDTNQEQKPSILVPMSIQQLLRIALLGAAIGAATWGAVQLLNIYAFGPMVCKGGVSIPCDTSLNYASAIGSVLIAGLGLLGLVKLQAFRSLLTVLAATISLWGVEILLRDWAWQTALLVSVLLFALAYSLYAWIVRLRSFSMAAVLIVVLVVAARFALNF